MIIFPTAAAYALIGGVRAFRWYAERRYRNRPVTTESIERLGANLRRLRAELEAVENKMGTPAKNLRLRALRAAYIDALCSACHRLEVSQPARPPALPRPKFTGSSRPCGSVGLMSGRWRRTERGSSPAPVLAYHRHVVRVLAVSDEADEGLCANVGLASGAELILACGDLPFDYLEYLMNALDVPLVFVPGNHDPDLAGYRVSRAGLTLRAGLPVRAPWPDGSMCADGGIADVAGLRVAGLGGCRTYNSRATSTPTASSPGEPGP